MMNSVICSPYDTLAHVIIAGRWRAFKLLLSNYRHRTDEEIMDALATIVRGGFR